MSGCAAIATLEGSVQGVVVQTSSDAVAVLEGEPHGDRRILDVLEALAHLVARERRGAARAVRQDLVAAEEQAALVELREDPPQGLDVVAVAGDVGVLEVDPVPHAPGEGVPVLEVAEDRLRGTPALNRAIPSSSMRLLALEAETPLRLDLDRQPVGVPAGPPLDVPALHRLEAAGEVLHRPREHVVDAGAPVRGRAAPRRRSTAARPCGARGSPRRSSPPSSAPRISSSRRQEAVRLQVLAEGHGEAPGGRHRCEPRRISVPPPLSPPRGRGPTPPVPHGDRPPPGS